MSIRRKAAVLGSASAVIAGMGAVPASATNIFLVPGIAEQCFGSGRADNKTHTFQYESVEPIMVAKLEEHRNYINNLGIGWTTQLVSPSGSTDAEVRDLDYTTWCGLTWHSPGVGGTIGLSACVTLNSAGECEQTEVRFDTSVYPALSSDSVRALACHEVGHSIGLKHRDEGCIATGLLGLGSITYSTHDKDHMKFDIA